MLRCGWIRVGRAGFLFFFFFNDTATTEIYTLSLHDALPIGDGARAAVEALGFTLATVPDEPGDTPPPRSEEHTSELQSRSDLVCRLLLEKKKKKKNNNLIKKKKKKNKQKQK